MDRILPVGCLTIVFSLAPLFSFSKVARDVDGLGDILNWIDSGWFGYCIYLLVLSLSIYYLFTLYREGQNKNGYHYYRELEGAANNSSVMINFLVKHLRIPKYESNAYQEKSFSYRVFVNARKWTVSPTLQRANHERNAYFGSEPIGDIDFSKISGGRLAKLKIIVSHSFQYSWFMFFWCSVIAFMFSNIVYLAVKGFPFVYHFIINLF